LADELKVKANSYKSGLKPIWCPGCGDFGVLAAAYRAFAELDLDPDRTVIVSGIGCSSRFPGFVATYGFHGVHGRALPTAMGVKLANPELDVIAVGGDGDGFAIGGGHFPHAARRNVDITYIIMNNQTYGLTKGQVSPTSLHDQKSPSTPFGNLEEPMNVLATAIAADCSYVAQGASFRSKELTELIVEGMRHPGFSFIDAFSPCTAFNNTTQEWKDAVYNLPAEHDFGDRAAAFAAALSEPMGIGIFYRHERPTLDGRVRAMQDAAPAGSVEELVETFAVRPTEPAVKPTY
jgi:2-oxoglutarate/2-oxoacid ferredoxin oxidoreductase subunit beta